MMFEEEDEDGIGRCVLEGTRPAPPLRAEQLDAHRPARSAARVEVELDPVLERRPEQRVVERPPHEPVGQGRSRRFIVELRRLEQQGGGIGRGLVLRPQRSGAQKGDQSDGGRPLQESAPSGSGTGARPIMR